MIIGIVGSIASGKDTVADYLVRKGFKAISLSDILRGVMREEDIEVTIPNMTEFGNNLRATKGHSFLAERASEQIQDGEDVIVTSLRQVGEVEFFQKRSDFTLIKLDAEKELRLQRLLDRNRPGDVKNMAELDEIEAKQADGKNGGMNMNRCYELADVELANDGTFEELYHKVDELIESIRGSR